MFGHIRKNEKPAQATSRCGIDSHSLWVCGSHQARQYHCWHLRPDQCDQLVRTLSDAPSPAWAAASSAYGAIINHRT
jgi:hypothetical protein